MNKEDVIKKVEEIPDERWKPSKANVTHWINMVTSKAPKFGVEVDGVQKGDVFFSYGINHPFLVLENRGKDCLIAILSSEKEGSVGVPVESRFTPKCVATAIGVIKTESVTNWMYTLATNQVDEVHKKLSIELS